MYLINIKMKWYWTKLFKDLWYLFCLPRVVSCSSCSDFHLPFGRSTVWVITEEYSHTPNDEYGTSSGTGSNRLFSKDNFGHPRLQKEMNCLKNSPQRIITLEKILRLDCHKQNNRRGRELLDYEVYTVFHFYYKTPWILGHHNQMKK